MWESGGPVAWRLPNAESALKVVRKGKERGDRDGRGWCGVIMPISSCTWAAGVGTNSDWLVDCLDAISV